MPSRTAEVAKLGMSQDGCVIRLLFCEAGRASQQEWRTPPLWGLGLLENIDAKVRYLHDGRARTLEEAILWHGGQGQASRDRFKAMHSDDRRKMIDFLQSL